MIKFSIIIPLFNKEKYISKTLNSICSQLKEDTEIVIIDDGSQDNSIDIINNYIEKYKNIKLFRYENNGVSVARNKGIKQSEGDFLVFVDADDIIKDGYLDDVRKTVSVIGSEFSILGYNYCRNGRFAVPKKFKDGFINYFKMYVKYGPPFCSSSVIISKNKLLDFNLFPENEWLGEDIYAWAKIILNGGKVYYRNYIATDYVTDNDGAMSKQKTEIKLIRQDNDIFINDSYYKKFIIHHKIDYLKSCLLYGDVDAVRFFLKKEPCQSFMLFRILARVPYELIQLLIKVKRKFR